MDVFEKRQENLTEDFFPEMLREISTIIVQDLKEDLE